MGKVIQYFNPDSVMEASEGQIYGGAMIAIIFIRLAFDHHYNHLTNTLGMQVRIACTSLIYRKVSILHYLVGKTTIRSFPILTGLTAAYT